MCKFDKAQTVAGEGPQTWPMIWAVRGMHGSNGAYFNRESAERFIAERIEPHKYHIVEYVPKHLAEVTPKLEEIARQVNEECIEYSDKNGATLNIQKAVAILRPFIIPASTGEANSWPDLIYGDKESWCGKYTRNGESNSGGNIGAWYANAVFWRNRAEGILNPGELPPTPTSAPQAATPTESVREGLWPTCDWCHADLERFVKTAGKCVKCGAIRLEASPSVPLLDDLLDYLDIAISGGKTRYTRDHGEPNPSPAIPYEVVFGVENYAVLQETAKNLRTAIQGKK